MTITETISFVTVLTFDPFLVRPPVQGGNTLKGVSLAEGIALSLVEAFAAAESELGGGAPGDAEPSLPEGKADEEATLEQAEAGAEKPEVAEPNRASTDEDQGDLQALLEALKPEQEDTKGEEPAQPQAGSNEWWEQQVAVETVDGRQTVALSELRDGFMRQADYTRKTQELADQRRVVSEAVEFHQAFMADPMGFARALAVQADLVGEDQMPPNPPEVARIRTAADVEAEVQKRVEERLASDPTMHQAKLAAAREAISQQFAAIEQQYGVSLSRENRAAIIEEATRQETVNLSLVFRALMADARSKRGVGSKKAAAPKRATVPPADVANQVKGDKPVETVEEAMDRAIAELSAG